MKWLRDLNVSVESVSKMSSYIRGGDGIIFLQQIERSVALEAEAEVEVEAERLEYSPCPQQAQP